MEHQVLVKRIYRLWMCEPRGVIGSRSLHEAHQYYTGGEGP